MWIPIWILSVLFLPYSQFEFDWFKAQVGTRDVICQSPLNSKARV